MTRYDPHSPLTLAIVGGAHQHVDYVLDEVALRRDAVIVAVVEHDAARRAALEARTGAPGYASLDAMLDEHAPVAAAVTTEPGLRAGAVATLAGRGVFSIVDKPLATTLGGLEAIESALAGRPLVTLMLEKRFYPVTRALKDLIDDGALGEIVTITMTAPHKLRPAGRPAWYFDPALYGGIVNDLAVHDIDLALWLTGAAPARIRGWTSPAALADKPGFPLAGRALLETSAGCQIAIDVDWLHPEASPRHGDYALRLTGSKGRADVHFVLNRLIVETHAAPAREVLLPEAIPPARYAFEHLAAGTPLAISTADSLRATRLALLAEESARTGGDWRNADQ